MHKVGVVIPTHPRRALSGMTQRAINSALGQTYQPSALCVYNDVERGGAPFARQRALMMNDCEWTAFLDSDDWFLPHHLETLVNGQIESSADYVYSWYCVNDPGNHHDPVFPPSHFLDPWNPDVPRQTTITVLVRTDLAKEIGFWDALNEETFPDGNRIGEDYRFTLACNERGTIHHVVERTWVWTHHGGNTSGQPNRGDAR